MDFVTKIIINIFLFLDKIVLSVNSLLFELFVEVAQAKFANEFFTTLTDNLYVIIGIFVIFKVAFSLVKMLANPDLLTDKEKGAGKLTTRIVIAFGIIIMIPTIFDMAYSLQAAVLQDNIIGRLIFGDIDTDNNDAIASQGNQMSMIIFKGLLEPSDEIKNSDDESVKNCIEALESATSISDLQNANGTNCFEDKYKDERILDYKPVVSTITLVIVAWLMAGFCIDIGIRLIKLGLLQLLGPICAVTYIGGSKDNAFSKWLKMTISMYVSVFIKLIIVFFITYVASKIGEVSGRYGELSGLAKTVIILGLLVFAKNATKLFSDLFGIQMDENGGLKGLAKAALIGGALGKVGGLAKTLPGLGASKLGGGLLGMMHGKSFAEGAAGGWKKERQAGKDMKLEQRKASHDQKTRTENYNRGQEIANNMANMTGTEEENLKAQFGEKYGESMYKSDQAKKAKFAAERDQELAHDKAKSAQQKLGQISSKSSVSSALRKINNYQQQIEALRAQGVADTDARIVGMQNGISNQNQVLQNEGYTQALNEYNAANEDMKQADIALGDATKVYDDLKKKHEDLQKMDKTHAKMQEQYDTYKLVEKGGGL